MQGKLTFRRRLDTSAGQYEWIGWTHQLPLAFVASSGEARVFDHNGDIIARLMAPSEAQMYLSRTGASGFTPDAVRTLLAFADGPSLVSQSVTDSRQSSKSALAISEEGRPQGGDADPETDVEIASPTGALLAFGVGDILLAAYPNLGDDHLPASALHEVLTKLPHTQRSDADAVSALLYPPKVSGTASGGRRVGARSHRANSSIPFDARSNASSRSGPASRMSSHPPSELRVAANRAAIDSHMHTASRATFASSVGEPSIAGSTVTRRGGTLGVAESIAGGSVAGTSFAAGSAAGFSCASGGGQSLGSHANPSPGSVSGASYTSGASSARSRQAGGVGVRRVRPHLPTHLRRWLGDSISTVTFGNCLCLARGP